MGRSSIYLFTLQMDTTAEVGPGRGLELGTASGCPALVAGDLPSTCAVLCSFASCIRNGAAGPGRAFVAVLIPGHLHPLSIFPSPRGAQICPLL